MTAPVYDPARPGVLRGPQAATAARRVGLNRTGTVCQSCGAVTYGFSDRCGSCGQAQR